MSDPLRKQLLALRLAQAASAAWSFLQADVDGLDNSKEAAEAYLGALALLCGYVLHANEQLAKESFTEEAFEQIMAAWKKDARTSLERTREHSRTLAAAEPAEVH